MANNIKITTLIENTAQGCGLVGEHGISFWVEYDGRKLLFDTGQSGVLINNAKILDIDMAQTEAIVISHGHYDHTGGLQAVLNHAKNANIYMHPDAVGKKYSFAGTTSKFIGISDGIRDILMISEKHKIIWTKEPTEIFPGLFVTGQVPKTNDFETDDEEDFFLDEHAHHADELPDDQSLFFNTDKGLVVIFGCAHAGVINILDYIVKISGVKKVHAIMGGMHLVGTQKERRMKVIENLKRFGLDRLGPAHCTGLEAAMEFRDAFPRRCFMCSVGTKIEF